MYSLSVMIGDQRLLMLLMSASLASVKYGGLSELVEVSPQLIVGVLHWRSVSTREETAEEEENENVYSDGGKAKE